jgi:mRNA interferase RelE/StbE
VVPTTYHVEIEVEAPKALATIANPDRTRIAGRIAGLGDDPRPSGCTKLSGMGDAYRVRHGNYRIVYTIDDVLTVVSVTRTAQSGRAYR